VILLTLWIHYNTNILMSKNKFLIIKAKSKIISSTIDSSFRTAIGIILIL